MERQDKDSIQTFDALYTTDRIQILKLLLPFLAPEQRAGTVIMIKCMELRYAISFIHAHPEHLRKEPQPFSLSTFREQLEGYCPPRLVSMLEEFQSIQNALQMYEEMKQMMDLFQGTDVGADPSDGPSDTGGQKNTAGPIPGPDPLNMLSGMLTPEQLELFRMFQSEFGTKAAEAPPDKED